MFYDWNGALVLFIVHMLSQYHVPSWSMEIALSTSKYSFGMQRSLHGFGAERKG